MTPHMFLKKRVRLVYTTNAGFRISRTKTGGEAFASQNLKIFFYFNLKLFFCNIFIKFKLIYKIILLKDNVLYIII